MPYIITTSEPFNAAVHCTRPAFSRTAVATLDEARDYVHQHGATFSVASIGGSGGTVGPLPDGTVIEVRPVTKFALGFEAGLIAADHPQLWKDADLVATYNKVQA